MSKTFIKLAGNFMSIYKNMIPSSNNRKEALLCCDTYRDIDSIGLST